MYICMPESMYEMRQVHWSYPKGILEILEKKAERLGYKLSDYIRYLLTKEAEKELEANAKLNKKAIEKVLDGIQDFEDGKVIIINSKEELSRYFDDKNTDR